MCRGYYCAWSSFWLAFTSLNSVLVAWISTVCLLMVCCSCSMICRISLVVTRPLVTPALVGSVIGELVWARSSSARVCLLVLGATVGSRFSDASVAAVPCVSVVARGSGGSAVGSAIGPGKTPARSLSIWIFGKRLQIMVITRKTRVKYNH